MTDPLPSAFGRDWTLAMSATFLGSAASELGELDRRSGDGDFGTNLTSAFKRAEREVETAAPQTFQAWMTCVSRGFLGTGGTSGPLFGMFFRDLARSTESGSPTVQELSEGLSRGTATVQRYGRARVGHKTMVDALAPAAEALTAAAGEAPAAALEAAAAAAREGAESTRDAVARRGRASYVGDVARGVVDPGAAAAALMLACAARAAGAVTDPASIHFD
ncbi:dihydroxyacetone kinase subunit DhaL [Tsukamurella sp. 8F]|uniref:dihydroxyacetone kinase subunit DhaL n=1 Tax=unclassified Tsukamurella TaxID=2633480 RepID=UPI0023BA016D|nr:MULTISPECIES: dihydroxyacetone kinase subunit DhaL [unclassified Tsukamurella]MDF0530329.1 dihydroxyacetone kinase subunit DhaL [Tsukamurella sp. 8J]MDF0587626.1 dihydroxyacetone kinase subunit DhaL [Tsukamurella sp. 8F]